MPDDLIPPELRSRLKDLRLTSRRATGGQGLGWHHSRAHGAGLEFAQYRPYEPGDELRQIDWKLYGRSDKFFVRESERESPLAVWILIDASASMDQADQGHPDRSRLVAAKSLTACLAELALRQGDRFGMIVLQEDGLKLLPPGNGVRQRDRLWLELHELTASGGFPTTKRLTPLWERIGAQDLIIVLTDGFDSDGTALMARLASAGREVLAIQILTADERDFRFSGGYRFRDPETGEELLGDGAALRTDFLRRFSEAQRALHAQWEMAGIGYAEYVLDEPLDLPLRRLFGGGGR